MPHPFGTNSNLMLCRSFTIVFMAYLFFDTSFRACVRPNKYQYLSSLTSLSFASIFLCSNR